MADDTGLKSSFEIAMERLKQQDADAGVTHRTLTDAEKAAIAEIRNFYGAKLAEQEVLNQSHLQRMMDPAGRDAIEAEWRLDRERLTAERDRKIAKVRGDLS